MSDYVWVTAAKAVSSALTEKHIVANPIADVSIRAPKKVISREDGKAFSSAEQGHPLGALAIKDTRERPFKAACRWVAWVCAYGGVRVGEITQPGH